MSTTAGAHQPHDWYCHDNSGLHKTCRRCSLRLDRLSRNEVWWGRHDTGSHLATPDNPVPGCTSPPPTQPPPHIPPKEPTR